LIAQNHSNAQIGCSDLWVAGLALEHCKLRWPEAILRADEVSSFLMLNRHIRHILILDDAAYSGEHIRSDLFNIEFKGMEDKVHIYGCHLHIGIPFITKTAKAIISENYFASTNWLSHTQIEAIKDIFSEEETSYFQSISPTKTLTYFDHRFPDKWSTMFHLRGGSHLLSFQIPKQMRTHGYITGCEELKNGEDTLLTRILDPGEWRQLVEKFIPTSPPLVPTIIPPYRLHHEEGQASLQKALTNKELGSRTLYPIPERYKKTIDLLNTAGMPVTITKKPEPHFLHYGFFKSLPRNFGLYDHF
jgi:hypothetical protein